MYIDDVAVSDVDLYAPTYAYGVKHFESSTLTANVSHTIRFVLQSKNASSTGYFLYLDRFLVRASRSIGPYIYSANGATHPYGLWNSPYSLGRDTYAYNQPQAYTRLFDVVDVGWLIDIRTGQRISLSGPWDLRYVRYVSGPHGGYLTTSHKCRECHAAHRARGRFKLTRGESRVDACDWCHGCGAGSGWNIPMDNDDALTVEYNTGHTLGFGAEDGSWKAPVDTYPAYTPKYYMGGFSCLDCHSAHANPARLLGFRSDGSAVLGSFNERWGITTILRTEGGLCYAGCHTEEDPIVAIQPGKYLLIKNPDVEISHREHVVPNPSGPGTLTISPGSEVPDSITTGIAEFSTLTPFPVNKVPVSWEVPVGVIDGLGIPYGSTMNFWHEDEFCVDCHDGAAGLHTVQAPVYSEERARYSNGGPQSSYDVAYGHDTNPRSFTTQMTFNPEDGANNGPSCRKCHRAASRGCLCHASSCPHKGGDAWDTEFDVVRTSTGATNEIDWTWQMVRKNWGWTFNLVAMRTILWPYFWETTTAIVNPRCSDDGNSYPHRTTSYKMSKNDLFGIGFAGGEAGPGQIRQYRYSDADANLTTVSSRAHDLDSVCLDCHNPDAWRATSYSDHADDTLDPRDNDDDELIRRGLP